MKRIRTSTLLAIALILNVSAFSLPALSDVVSRTKAQAIEIAKQRNNGGRVLSVEKSVSEDGVVFYAIKIISKGRVKIYKVLEIVEASE